MGNGTATAWGPRVSPPLISVVLPVYNGERYLREALDSLLAQTYEHLEIILIDDGSTDHTPEIIAGYADPVTCLRQANAGPAAARNVGVARARGDFVTFMDHDDIAHPEKLERQLACLDERPDADACLVYVQNFWFDELADERRRLAGRPLTQPVLAYTLPSMLARAAVFERVGPFDARFRVGQDTDWFIRASELGVIFAPVEEILYYRRIHRTNLTRLEAKTNRGELADMVKRALDRRRSGSKPVVADSSSAAPTPEC